VTGTATAQRERQRAVGGERRRRGEHERRGDAERRRGECEHDEEEREAGEARDEAGEHLGCRVAAVLGVGEGGEDGGDDREGGEQPAQPRAEQSRCGGQREHHRGGGEQSPWHQRATARLGFAGCAAAERSAGRDDRRDRRDAVEREQAVPRGEQPGGRQEGAPPGDQRGGPRHPSRAAA
jgi:hypothetical protein